MQAFAVVLALLAVAALGWALSAGARWALRRHGVPTDEGDVYDPAAPEPSDEEPGESGGAVEAGADERAAADAA